MARSIVLLMVLMCGAGLGLAASATTGIDPTRPLDMNSFNQPVVGSDAVTFILVSKERTFAVVNGQTVKVGDRVGSQEVLGIYPDRVEMVDGSTGEVEVEYLTKTKVLN